MMILAYSDLHWDVVYRPVPLLAAGIDLAIAAGDCCQHARNGFARLLRIRPRARPNSLMVRRVDDLLGRKDRLNPALRRLHVRQSRGVPGVEQFMQVHRPFEICTADVAAYIAEVTP